MLKPGFAPSTILCVPLVDANDKRIGVIQVLNKNNGVFTARDEKLLRALAAQAAVATENARLYDNLRELRKNEQHLNEVLQTRHKQLQAAYQQIEGTNENLKAALRKVSLARTLSFLFVGVMVTVAVIYDWSDIIWQDAWVDDAPPSMTDDNPSFFVVSPQPVRDTIRLNGRIHPLEVVNIVSPLQGKIIKRHIRYGDFVEKNQVLIEIDTNATEILARNAHAEHIKAQERLEILQDWENSSEASDMRRNLIRLQLEQNNLQKKLAGDRRRIALGITTRSEYELAQQALVQLNLEKQAAEQAFREVLSKANTRQIQLAELDLESAAQKAAEFEKILKRSVVRAPVSGVITWPEGQGDKAQEPRRIESGTLVNEGEALFSIGNMEGISVKSQVDEVDVSKLSIGQLVTVSGDAFPEVELNGELTNIASQAGSNGQRMPFFTVTVQVKQLLPWQRNSLRIGMSTDLAVLVYEKNNALLVPIRSVSSDGESWRVQVKDRSTRELNSVKVKPGVTNQDKVEILEGLQPGDEVLIPN